MALGEVATDSSVVSETAVEPPFDVINAGSRFVFVPAAQFGAEGIGGWIAKIVSVLKNHDKTTTLQFKDADGKYSRQYFKFEHVVKHFKPLS